MSTNVVASLFTPDELAAFEQDGYLIVRGLAEPDLCDHMRAVTLDNVQRLIEPIEFEVDLQYPGAPESPAALGGRTVRRLLQAHGRDYVFTRWLTSPQLTGRLKQLLGPEYLCPLAHHNCIMTKEPQFSSDTGWHQDIRYWSFTRPDLVNVWLALGQERAENGCLKIIPGSHREKFQRAQFDDDTFFRTDVPENQPLLSREVRAELEPGDVLFFHCRTLHAATRNYSNETKNSVVFTFRSLDNPPLPGTRSALSPELLLH
ncbi:MAG: phytanoyl-CoA dioxygenase family protein [Planctomycetaceae bacterium]|nr:phytanoyl-CoA dioxygenase family protein [Planctomycetaceae bacterium]